MRKIILILGVFLILVIGIALFFFYSSQKNKNSFPQTVLPTPIPANESANDKSASIYKGSFVSARIPTGWEVIPGFFKGGEEVGIRPQGMAAGDFVPGVYLTKFNPGMTSIPDLLKQRRSQFDRLSYKESKATVGGSSAVLLSGKFPFYTKNGQAITEPVIDNVYFLERNGSLIEIQVRYPSNLGDANIIGSLSYIINNLQLK